MECKHVFFSGHAVQRMFERGISKSDVLAVIASGEVIAEYPDDEPFPSYLILGFIEGHPVHIVLGVDHLTQTGYLITAYTPDLSLWNSDFKTRRAP